MNAGNLWLIIKLLPLLVLTAALFGWFGWWLRRKFHAPLVSSSKPHATPDDLPARERVKKLENSLAKSDTAQKSLRHELETLQAKTVSKHTLEKAAKDLADAQQRLDADHKRIQALETDLKKARETLNTLNSAAAEANKGQRDRTFALENELSKTREALAILEARPDNSLTLQGEVDRLRETLTNSTRVIGELRKQETTSAQTLTKCQTQLEAATRQPAATAPDSVSLLPAMELAERNARKPGKESTSAKVAQAIEDVERLHALNAQKEAERLAAEQAATAAKTQQGGFAAEQDRLTVEHAEQNRLAAEKAAAEQAETDRLAAAQAEADRLAAEKAAAAQAEAGRLAAEKAAAEQAEAERLAAEQAETDRLAAEQAAAAQAEQDRLAAEQAAAAQAEQDRLAAEKAAAAQAEQDSLAAEKAAAAQAEADRLAAVTPATQQTELELVAAEPAATEPIPAASDENRDNIQA
jgi:chemosensory pili system protein ChpA (sensor histidine kinase/response regulator)